MHLTCVRTQQTASTGFSDVQFDYLILKGLLSFTVFNEKGMRPKLCNSRFSPRCSRSRSSASTQACSQTLRPCCHHSLGSVRSFHQVLPRSAAPFLPRDEGISRRANVGCVENKAPVWGTSSGRWPVRSDLFSDCPSCPPSVGINTTFDSHPSHSLLILAEGKTVVFYELNCYTIYNFSFVKRIFSSCVWSHSTSYIVGSINMREVKEK